MKKRVINPPWTRDELILALDLYFRHHPSKLSKTHTEVIKLSNMLNSMPIHKDRPDNVKFRNANGVYMKLCNYLRFDPNYSGKGLQRGGKLEGQIWKEFADNPKYLRQVALGIVENIDLKSASEPTFDSEEEEFPEGKILYRQHKYRERNRRIVEKVKNNALKKGKLYCQVCGFNFYETYGELGRGYIECHHTKPVSEYKSKSKTRVEDMALVCSNCHRMLHRKRPWLTLNKLSSLLTAKDSLLI